MTKNQPSFFDPDPAALEAQRRREAKKLGQEPPKIAVVTATPLPGGRIPGYQPPAIQRLSAPLEAFLRAGIQSGDPYLICWGMTFARGGDAEHARLRIREAYDRAGQPYQGELHRVPVTGPLKRLTVAQQQLIWKADRDLLPVIDTESGVIDLNNKVRRVALGYALGHYDPLELEKIRSSDLLKEE